MAAMDALRAVDFSPFTRARWEAERRHTAALVEFLSATRTSEAKPNVFLEGPISVSTMP